MTTGPSNVPPEVPGGEYPRSPVTDWVEPAGSRAALYSAIEKELRVRRRRIYATIAGSVTVVALAATVWFSRFQPNHGDSVTHRSIVVTAPRTQTLTDGSVIELSPAAEVVEQFSNDFRRVIQLGGGAHFQVAKNPTRPFVVVAGAVEVRAVGTAFSVQVERDQIDVIVTEGVVAVTRSASNGPAIEQTITAGNRIALPNNAESSLAEPAVAAIGTAELNQRLEWRVPRVNLSSTPLSEVIPIFNRYAGVTLSIATPDLGELELSGVLRADNVESLLRVLDAEFQVKSHRNGTHIVLRK
jgi:transmembrane sensor